MILRELFMTIRSRSNVHMNICEVFANVRELFWQPNGKLQKNSTKFANLREQFMILCELFMNICLRSNVHMNIREVFANVHEHFAKLRILFFATYRTCILSVCLAAIRPTSTSSIRLQIFHIGEIIMTHYFN